MIKAIYIFKYMIHKNDYAKIENKPIIFKLYTTNLCTLVYINNI